MADEADITPGEPEFEAPNQNDLLTALLSDPQVHIETPATNVVKDDSDAVESQPDGLPPAVEAEVKVEAGEPKADEAADAAGEGAAAEGTAETTAQTSEGASVEGATETGEGGIPIDPAHVAPAPAPTPDPRAERQAQFRAAEAALHVRAQKHAAEQAAYDAKIADKKAKGEDEDFIDDYPVAMRLLREANLIQQQRNDLLEAKQVTYEQDAETERYWTKEYTSTYKNLSAEEGRKIFSEEIAKSFAKYVKDDVNNTTKVAMAHAAATELFEHRSKTIDGQRKARAGKPGSTVAKPKPPVAPKTPITPGGGRVLPPPVAGSASTRVQQPRPKTNEEGLSELAVKAGKSPVDILMS